jgi:hypothetical protein
VAGDNPVATIVLSMCLIPIPFPSTSCPIPLPIKFARAITLKIVCCNSSILRNKNIEGSKKMTVYVYLCVNSSCRYILKRSGMRKSMIECPVCGAQMRIIKEEKE